MNDTYSDARAREWISRSNAPEYQKAYQTIVRTTPDVSQGTVLEFGIGPGNLLVEIKKQRNPRLLIGIDASGIMLDAARERLAPFDPKIKIVSPSEFRPDDEGIVLVRDNVNTCKLPPDIADLTLFCFPAERGMDYFPPIDEMLEDEFYDIFPHGHLDPSLLIRLRADYHIARTTKLLGRSTLVLYEYFVSKELERSWEKIEKGISRINGLEVKSHKFFDSPKIWADTDDAKEMTVEGIRSGYRIIQRHKLFRNI